jgi:site-specific DNA-cytosine methylase
MRILIACEESQAVCKEFRLLGHEAYSCDIQDCSSDKPEWHIKGDVIQQLDKGWDMMIAFPPCTHLAVSGARHFSKKIADGRQKEGIDFFMKFVNAAIDKIVIENPIGIMSKLYRKPDQIIHPYYFGDPFSKSTCLWLKNVPKLVHQKETDLFNEKTHTKKGDFKEWVDKKSGKLKRQALWNYEAFADGKTRSKTFPGIAKAMAEQWGKN